MTTPAARVRRSVPAAPRVEPVESIARPAPERITARPPYLSVVPRTPAVAASTAPASATHVGAVAAPAKGGVEQQETGDPSNGAKAGKGDKDAKHAHDGTPGHGAGGHDGAAHGANAQAPHAAGKKGGHGEGESSGDTRRLDKMPTADSGTLRLEAETFSLPEADVPFGAPTELTLRPVLAAKPQAPTRDTANYRTVFTEAAQAARRLHDALLGDAARLASEAQGAASAHASARQADLDASLLAMDGGLADARTALGASADAALQLIDSRAAGARQRIRRAAGGARVALKAEQTLIDNARKGPADRQQQIVAKAAAYSASIEAAGTSAATSLAALGSNPSTYYPAAPAGLGGDGALCGAAVLEAIVTRVPPRAGHRLMAYSDESGKQKTAMAASFKSLPQEFAAAFATVDQWITQTGKAGPAALDSATGAALRQLAAMTLRLRGSIVTARTNAEIALIRQHAAARKQAAAVHRNRAHAEAQAESRRASRDISSLRALATAQGVSLRVVIDGLGHETRRGEKDFARAVISTARAFGLRVDATNTAQRPKMRAAAALGADAADRQAVAAGARLRDSAQALGHQFVDTANDSGRAIEGQANEGTADFGRLAEPVSGVLRGYLPPIAKAFECQICRLGNAVDSTGQRVEAYMAGENSPATAAKCACPDTPAPAAASTAAAATGGPTMVPSEFVTIGTNVGKNPTTDAKIKDLERRSMQEVPKKMEEKVAALWDGAGAIHTNTEQVMSALRAITAAQGSAVKSVFSARHHWNAETYLRLYLPKAFSARSTDKLNVEAAIDYLNGNNIEGALYDLQAAVNFSNEEARVEAIQRSLTPAQWAELKGLHGAEIKEVRDDIDGVDQQVFDALASEGDHFRMQGGKAELFAPTGLGEGAAKADALRLREKMERNLKKRGEGGADDAVDTLAAAQGRAGADVLSGKDALDLDEHRIDSDAKDFDNADPVGERNAKQWQRTKEAFDQLEQSGGATRPKDAQAGWSIAAFAGKARDHDVFVPDQYSDAGGHVETVHEHIRDDQQRLMQYIVDFGADSEEAAAARLMVEVKRDGGQPKPERLDMAMHADVLDAHEGEDKSALSDKGKLSRMAQAKERQQKVLLKYDQLKNGAALTKPRPGDELVKAGEAPSEADQTTAERVRQELSQQVSSQGDPTTRKLNERTLRAPAKDWNTEKDERIQDAKAGIDFAMEHEAKRGDTLKRTLGRLDRHEVDLAFAAWEDDPAHTGRKLDEELNLGEQGSWWTEQISGDERQEIELLRLGVAKKDEERAEVSRMRAQQQVRDAGWLGKLAGKVTGDYDALEQSRDDIERLTGLPHGAFDAFGRATNKAGGKGNFDDKGKFKPPAGGSVAQFELALNMTHITAESYKAMTDRVANAVVTGLMVAAAVITTALTGGAAASIWIPVLVTMGAGLVGIALSASIKGARYSRAEMERDLVMTFVQAATAGLGAAAGVAIKGGMPALRAVASEVLISEEVLTGVIEASGRQGLSKGWALVAEMGVGAMSNATNNAAGAAMDPTNRAQGESGSKAFDAGLTGFLSGGFGSALMKPVGALGKGAFGHYGERAFGAAANNVATRGFEIGMEERRGTGERRQTADITDDLTGAGVQGLAQGALEEAASQHTDARRAAAARPAGGSAMPEAQTVSASSHATAAHEPTAAHAAAERASAPIAPHEAPAVAERPPFEPPPVPSSLSHVVKAAHNLAPEAPRPMLEPGVVPSAPATAAPEVVKPGSGQRAGEPGETQAMPGAGGQEKAGRPRPPPLPGEPHPGIPWAPADFMEGAVMIDPHPQSRAEIEVAYRRTIAADPSREVGIYRNPVTGEHILIFGNAEMIFIGLRKELGEAPHPAEPAATRQDWKEILPADIGRWELEAHYHPGKPGQHDDAPMWRRVPSTGEGGVGDLQVLRQESHAAGGAPRRSVIDFIHEGKAGYTAFGFDPAEAKPYWIDVEDPATGQREEKRFATPHDYEQWAKGHGAAPNLDAPGAPQARPLPAGGLPHDEELMLRHGTTRGDAEKLRAGGIDVHRKSGEAEDFSRGFYMTLDAANAHEYAQRRSGGAGGEVLSTSMRLGELGVVVDVREGGEHRAQWDAFLDREPPAYPAWAKGLFTNSREFLTGNGKYFVKEIQRGAVFEAFLHEAELGHADAIRGDLGKGLTGGIAAHSDGEQVAIRSKALADKLNERMGFGPASGQPQGPVLPGAGKKAAGPVRDAMDDEMDKSFGATFGPGAKASARKSNVPDKAERSPASGAAQAEARAAYRRQLSNQVLDGGLSSAESAAREQRAWAGALDMPQHPMGQLDPRLEAILRESPQMLAAARMDPELVKRRFERMLEKSPLGKPTAARFVEQWDAFTTSLILPLASENQATFRLGKERDMDILKSESTNGKRKNTYPNEGGIDIIGVERPKPPRPVPAHAEVYLIDDKAESRKRLSRVSAQTENLGQNLRAHANEFKVGLDEARDAGIHIDPLHEKAVKQLADAAKQIEDLDKSRIGRGGARSRHRQDRYIDAAKAILDENHIHMEITSERGSIRTLSKWLERYGFRMAFDDEDARDKEPLTVPPR